MRYLNFLMTIGWVSLVGTVAHAGGTTVEGGGDGIVCDPSAENAFSGLLSFDYLMTFDASRGTSDDIVGQSWEDLSHQIEELLSAHMPATAKSYRDFAATVYSNDPKKERQWFGVSSGLNDLGDEPFSRAVPSNCQRLSSSGRMIPNLQQLVRRREITTAHQQRLFYDYDYHALASLREMRPLQFSYLMVHEWLWDYTLSPWINRVINRLLHSKLVHRLSTTDFRDYIASLGVDISESGELLAYERDLGPLSSIFAKNSNCDPSQRVTAEFHSRASVHHISLDPGERAALDLLIPESAVDPIEWKSSCGFALVFNASGDAKNASLAVDFIRGPVTTSFVIDLKKHAADGPSFVHGQCLDKFCFETDGSLASFFTPRSLNGSRYSMVIKNRSNKRVDMHLPYLFFVKSK